MDPIKLMPLAIAVGMMMYSSGRMSAFDSKIGQGGAGPGAVMASTPKPQPARLTDTTPTAEPEIPCTPAYATVELFAGRDGHFYPDVVVNNVRLKMVVDTGATLVALDPSDAKKIGVTPAGGKPISISTANGVVFATKKTLRKVTVERLTLCDIEAVLLPGSGSPFGGAGGQSLLGLSFLHRIAGYAVRGNQLVLSP